MRRLARLVRVRSPALLIALVVMLLAYPRLEGIAPRWVISALMIWVLASAAYTIGTSRIHLIGAAVFGIPALTSRALFGTGEVMGSVASNVTQLLFMLYVISVLFGFVLRAGEVGVEKLSAAGALYLLMGLAWMVMYQVVELRHPGSFSLATGDVLRSSDLLYFSYVTLTTLGYGDVTPTNDYSRSLAMLEALAGSFFMAVLVARLVALYKRQDRNELDRSEGLA